jgi:membrane glycosyltransferase
MFPIWPSANLKLMLTLFGLTASLLLAPKVLSLTIIILRGQARYYGGVAKLLTGAVFEFFHSVLLAPVRMLFHTSFVLAALTGIKLDWKSPPRDDAITTVGEAARRHGLHTAFAAAWIVAILMGSASFPWWLSPILAGLLLAIPLSAWTSHAAPGRWLRKRKIFQIPEEVELPHVLAEAERYEVTFAAMPKVVDSITDEVAHVEIEAAIPAHPHATGLKALAQARLVDAASAGGPKALTNTQRMRLLSDAQAMDAVRARVLTHESHADWWTPVSPPSQHSAPCVEPAPAAVEPAL